MISIPIGEIFEAFIEWLKDTFAVVFDAISAVLDFAIQALENVLLLQHDEIYPSLILAIGAGFLAFAVGRRVSRQAGLIAGIAGFVVLGGIELWRYQQLENDIDPAEAREMVGTFNNLRELLDAEASEGYGRGLDAVEALRQTDDLGAEAADALDDVKRELEDLRAGRYDDAEDEFLDLLADEKEGDLTLTTEQKRIVRDVADYYSTFSLLEDSERIIDDLEEIEKGEPELARGFVNARAYDRLQRRLDAAGDLEEEWAGTEAFVAAHKEVKDLAITFNPDRLRWYSWAVMIVLFVLLANAVAGRGLAIFTGIGFLLIVSMGFWVATMESLALVLSATLFALIIGIPVGISAARSNVVDKITRPILDFMQTMPAFVYLIPAVLFFGLGKVPGAMATLIFAMPPAVRLTSLGIRQVPTEVVEACLAFGATPKQLLYKAQLPIARPTILAGLNQTIMLALSMVVIGGMIGAGGLGQEVLSGITQLKIGLGFESGISVVILAIFLDRVTQSMGGTK
jgi:glycine betaine/proline transport system permease protein